MKDSKYLIVSGLSGSGKSTAIKAVEDLGYFCVDNLPTALLPVFARLCEQSARNMKMIAVGIDIRERDFFEGFAENLEALEKEGYTVQIIFLEATDEVLLRRYSETRRKHPLANESSIIEGINKEKEILQDIRKRAHKIFDTSEFSVHQLRDVVTRYVLGNGKKQKLNITIVSFGYKYGVPVNADLVFDIRFLQNPYFRDKLKILDGNNQEVVEYLFQFKDTKRFLKNFYSFIDFLIPCYEKEGKSYLTVALGCTGGRHRSVAISNQLSEHLKKSGYRVFVDHRDIEKG